MNRFLIAIFTVLLVQSQARSQSTETPKFEVAAEFTSLEREGFGTRRSEAGFGGRFTFNLNRLVSLETATYYFPKRCFDCQNNGNLTEVFGGVKVGKQFEKWGIFAKARPGIASFSDGKTNIEPDPASPVFPFRFEPERLTTFAADVGGVVEFYCSKRIVTRFDAGDTLIHFGRRRADFIAFNSTTATFFIAPLTLPPRTAHNFQFMASVGWRF